MDGILAKIAPGHYRAAMVPFFSWKWGHDHKVKLAIGGWLLYICKHMNGLPRRNFSEGKCHTGEEAV
jgi:hypothetical protein